MYVLTYVHTHVRTFMCIYVCFHVLMYCAYICTYSMYVCTYVRTYVSAVCAYLSACTYVRMCSYILLHCPVSELSMCSSVSIQCAHHSLDNVCTLYTFKFVDLTTRFLRTYVASPHLELHNVRTYRPVLIQYIRTYMYICAYVCTLYVGV